MIDYDIKILGGVILAIVILLLIAAIWLGSILLKEAEEIKAASKNVQSAFNVVNVEVTRKLKNNRAIHFADLLLIVEKVSKVIPGIKVELEKNFELKQVSIVIEKDGIKATYTLLATIVEIPYRSALAKNI
ncbi:hypothetical protein N1M2_6 [Klebsiella phage N1M2]|uniref:Uncharacterized protein n=1 Tax=Klebsiella phage N1M2 TaxID=2664939 RepID=A0A6B7ZEY2_9CAUD|nr:hypothetical protein PQB72_gp006 [Klebsiella phage N1M2]QGH71869.1 hypothetical protein N1M2_6 [Klebsiella phage N1M2]